MEDKIPPQDAAYVTVRKKEGLDYQLALIEKRITKAAGRLQCQIDLMNSYIQQGTSHNQDTATHAQETVNLESLLFDLMQHILKKKELAGASNVNDELETMIDNFDDQIFELKKKFSQLILVKMSLLGQNLRNFPYKSTFY